MAQKFLIKTLFVCRGNTCRSPLCETLFNEILDANPFLKYTFDYAKSAGVQTYTHKVSNGAMKIGATHGLAKRMKTHKCTQFETELFEEYDHILCMDGMNMNDLVHYSSRLDEGGDKSIRRWACTTNSTKKSASAMKKVAYLRSYDSNSQEIEIDDPIGADLSTYETTYQQCLSCIFEYIKSKTIESQKVDIDISKFSKSGFSSSKVSVIFICVNNLILSPLCEAIFNKKISKDQYLSDNFNLASSVSAKNSGWGRSCPEKLVKLMEAAHDLDLSMHETDSFSSDVYRNDVVVPLGDSVCEVVGSYSKRAWKSDGFRVIQFGEIMLKEPLFEEANIELLYQKCLQIVDEVIEKIISK